MTMSASTLSSRKEKLCEANRDRRGGKGEREMTARRGLQTLYDKTQKKRMGKKKNKPPFGGFRFSPPFMKEIGP